MIILICYLPYLIDFQHSLTYGSIHKNHCFRSWHIFIIFSLYIYIFFTFIHSIKCFAWCDKKIIKRNKKGWYCLFNKGSWIRRLTAKLSVRSVRCQKYGQIVKINCDSVLNLSRISWYQGVYSRIVLKIDGIPMGIFLFWETTFFCICRKSVWCRYKELNEPDLRIVLILRLC